MRTIHSTLRSLGPVILLIVAFGSDLATQPSPPPADLVLVNGNVVTVDEKFSVASALAVRDGKFVAIGSNDVVRRHIGKGTRVIEGRGRTVIPGLIDTHVHALGVAEAEAAQPFRNLTSIGDLQDWIKAEAARQPKGTWLWTPRTYPTRFRERRFPTREELDAAAPEHPVVVDAAYALSLNAAALRAAGITRSSPDPAGGAIVKDAAGEPTGLLRNVGGLLARFRPEPGKLALDTLEKVHQQYSVDGDHQHHRARRRSQRVRVVPLAQRRGPFAGAIHHYGSDSSPERCRRSRELHQGLAVPFR